MYRITTSLGRVLVYIYSLTAVKIIRSSSINFKKLLKFCCSLLIFFKKKFFNLYFLQHLNLKKCSSEDERAFLKMKEDFESLKLKHSDLSNFVKSMEESTDLLKAELEKAKAQIS